MTPAEQEEVRRACLDLAHRYCVLSDNVDAEGVAGLFTADGHYERGAVVADGREALLAMVRNRPAGLVTRHVLTTAVIDPVGEDDASGRLYALTFASGEGFSPASPILRENLDRYRLTKDGWRIASRVVLTPFDGV